jgi:D-alanyl-D-alanine carboxypeptidase
MDAYGQVLYAHNADASLPMASTTKIMTALVVIESVDVETTVKIPAAAVGVEGSSAYLIAGEEMRIIELLHALMLESANDAAVALAITVAGGVEDFADLMNAKARELGLNATHFMNPHGLDHEEHYTSARDLATLTAAALQNETFAKIVSTVRYSAPVEESDTIRLYLNHNRLLREYEGCVGVKTGYTKRCGRCLVSAARRNGITLIAVTLSDPDDWRDHRALLDYGFATCRETLLADIGEIACTIPVVGGTTGSVIARNIQSVSLTLPMGTETTMRLEIPRFCWGSVRAGEQIGQAVFSVNGTVAATVPIIAENDVAAIVYEKTVWDKIGDFFSAFLNWLVGLFA